MTSNPIMPLALVVAFFIPRLAWSQWPNSNVAVETFPLNEIEKEMQRREEDLRRYNARLERIKQEAEATRRDLAVREQEVRNAESNVRERLRSLCRLSRGGYLKLVRGARSLADLVISLRYVKARMNYDLQALQAHKDLLEEIEARRRKLAKQVAAQSRLSERIAAYRDELRAQRDLRLLGKTSRGDVDAWMNQGDETVFPVGGQTRFQRQGLKEAPLVRILSQPGAPVFAVQDGVVRAAAAGESDGVVVIEHGGGYTSFYRGLGDVAVAQGQFVSAGEQVGEVGTQGVDTGLEFRVTHVGRPLEPTQWLGL